MYFQDTFTLSNSRDPWMKGREGRTNRIRQGLIPSFKQHWVCVMIFCINTQSNILRIEMTAAYLNQVFSDTIFVYPFSFFLCSLCKPRFFFKLSLGRNWHHLERGIGSGYFRPNFCVKLRMGPHQERRNKVEATNCNKTVLHQRLPSWASFYCSPIKHGATATQCFNKALI